MKERCMDCGDFGHTNLWGTPYLMFSVYCDLPKNHDGPHQGNEEITIRPSSEVNGRKIRRESVHFVGSSHIRISWENES